ncbi:MAG: transcription elongation factor subunit Spt4 [Candidatus Korarchaeota archaeon]
MKKKNEKACRVCRAITTKDRCPICGSYSLSFDFEGFVYVVDPENSEIAKEMGIKKPGLYAVKVL